VNPESFRGWSMKLVIWSFLFPLLVLTGGQAELAEESLPSEYQLKAAYLFNFAKFVEWPPEAFPEPTAPFTIGILGEDPFDEDLERTVKGKAVAGRRLVIRHVKALAELKSCHIVFISRSESRKTGRWREIFKALGAACALTVSEADGFVEAGGMINFVTEGTRVRFQINDPAARRAGLKISSKLLNLAKKEEP